MILQIPMKNSINKYKDCDSAYWWSPSWNFDIVVGFVSLLLHCCFLTSMSIRTGEQKHYYYYFFIYIEFPSFVYHSFVQNIEQEKEVLEV
jgi:bacteriorhodopsin